MGWAPQPVVCWYCGRQVGSAHASTCEFVGIVDEPRPRGSRARLAAHSRPHEAT